MEQTTNSTNSTNTSKSSKYIFVQIIDDSDN